MRPEVTVATDPGGTRQRGHPPFVELGLLLVIALLWFAALGHRELFDPDEGRYAEIPREMVQTGDWVTPRLNGLIYLEKPPLQYWITAAAYEVFGASPASARIWPALSGFFTLLLVWWTSRRIAGRTAGCIAALSLSGSLLFFAFGRVLTLDMGLTFFLSAAVCSLIASQDQRVSPAARWRWEQVMWAAMGLAFLSKGLVGIALPVMTLLAYMAVQRDASILRRLHWWSGLSVLLVIAVPWLVLVQVRNPEFLEFFFIHEHLTRYANPSHGRLAPWWFFIAVLALGGLPFSFSWPRAVIAAWQSTAPSDNALHVPRLLLVWIVVVTGFFSLSSSKLPAYILPVLPAFAILVGVATQRDGLRVQRDFFIGLLACGLVLTVLGAMAPFQPWTSLSTDALDYARWMLAAGLFLILTALLGWWLSRRSEQQRASSAALLLTMSIGVLMALHSLVTGAQVFASRYSAKKLLSQAREHCNGFDLAAPFYSFDMFDQTVPFLLRRTVTLVGFSDELALGIDREPNLVIPQRRDWRPVWIAHTGQAYAIMPSHRMIEEAQAGIAFRVLANDGRTSIIARR